MAYRVKKAFENYPELTTVVDGKRVALNAAYTHETKGTATKPPEKISVPLATQAQLKAIFERGDPCVEEIKDDPERLKNPFDDYKKAFDPGGGVTDKMLIEEQGKKKDVKNERK